MKTIKIILAGMVICILMVAIKPMFLQESESIRTSFVANVYYNNNIDIGKYALMAFIALVGFIGMSIRIKHKPKLYK